MFNGAKNLRYELANKISSKRIFFQTAYSFFDNVNTKKLALTMAHQALFGRVPVSVDVVPLGQVLEVEVASMNYGDL